MSKMKNRDAEIYDRWLREKESISQQQLADEYGLKIGTLRLIIYCERTRRYLDAKKEED